MTYLINPNFLCRNLTGIERFAFETCRSLDKLLTPQDDVRIIIPSNAKTVPEYKNIKLIKSDKPLKSFPLWDLFQFAGWCRKLKATGINFSNTAPLGKNCGLAFIHDIYAKDFPQDFSSRKEKLIRTYSTFNYKNITKNARKVLTVSDFSRKQIQKAYKISDQRIEVIPNGWEHFKEIQEALPQLAQKEKLENGSFYFTLGSLQKRKNLKWILDYAKKHPEETFAISGKAVSGYVSNELDELKKLSNIKLLGYVSDQEVKWLMKNCKAFIFPSYYEGFGIPPLEALSVGAKIIVADSSSLSDIYRDAAIFINPYDTNCNLDQLLKDYSSVDKKAEIEKILADYSYDKAAQKLYTVLSSLQNQKLIFTPRVKTAPKRFGYSSVPAISNGVLKSTSRQFPFLP